MAAPEIASALLFILSAHTVTLQEAEHAAETNHPDVRRARAAVAGGEARVEQMRAPLLPQVKLGMQYLRTTGNRPQRPGRTTVPGNPMIPPAIRENTLDTYNWWEFGITGNVVLWDFGQNLNRWRAAEERAAALGDTERAVKLQVIVGARAAFFRARAQKALVEVARETLLNEERHLTQIEGFVQAGSRPEIDLVQARAIRATRRVQLITAENAYTLARASLNEAMGTTGGTDYDVADDMLGPIEGESGPVEPLIESALRARPDVAAMDAEMRGQGLTIRAANEAYFPILSLVAGATDAGIQLFSERDALGLPRGMAWNLFGGLELVWPIFQGFLTRGQIREANAALDGLHAQRDALVQGIWVAVQQAAAGVRAAKEALAAADEGLTSARERLRLAEGRYAAGAGNIIELSDAQAGNLSAAAQKVGAEYQLAAARAELAVALGRK